MCRGTLKNRGCTVVLPNFVTSIFHTVIPECVSKYVFPQCLPEIANTCVLASIKIIMIYYKRVVVVLVVLFFCQNTQRKVKTPERRWREQSSCPYKSIGVYRVEPAGGSSGGTTE